MNAFFFLFTRRGTGTGATTRAKNTHFRETEGGSAAVFAVSQDAQYYTAGSVGMNPAPLLSLPESRNRQFNSAEVNTGGGLASTPPPDTPPPSPVPKPFAGTRQSVWNECCVIVSLIRRFYSVCFIRFFLNVVHANHIQYSTIQNWIHLDFLWNFLCIAEPASTSLVHFA